MTVNGDAAPPVPPSPRAQPQFWQLSEEDVRLALQNGNPDNPVGCEVVRIAKAYGALLTAVILEHRGAPSTPLYEPKCPIEVVALDMYARAKAWQPRSRKTEMH